jgi:hypothetical protein|tara:strand:+ start:419 stop:745 length:327 start_codon:yes stop_codon:yes gene_type:complete
MNYFLETEVKPIQLDNGLSLHQRYQSMRYRAIRFPGSEQASVRPAAVDTRFGNAPNVSSPLAGASLGQASSRLGTQPFIDYGQPEFTMARREVAYGVNPFPSGLNEIG